MNCEKCGHELQHIDGGWVAWGFHRDRTETVWYQIGRFQDAEMPRGTIFVWLADSFREKLPKKYPKLYCPRGHTMQVLQEGGAI